MLHAAVEDDTSSFLRIIRIQIKGTSTADFAATRTSDDFDTAEGTFDPAIAVGEMALGDGSFEIRYGLSALGAYDEQVARAAVVGVSAYADETNGGLAVGRFAKSLRMFGRGDINYLIAPDGGAVGLYKAVEGSGQTDITPNDGDPGIVVSQGGLCMPNVDEDVIFMLASFAGSFKLARSIDQGDNWNFNTDPGASAAWVDCNPRNDFQVYIANGSDVLYSQDGGVTTVSKTVPFTGVKGIAVL